MREYARTLRYRKIRYRIIKRTFFAFAGSIKSFTIRTISNGIVESYFTKKEINGYVVGPLIALPHFPTTDIRHNNRELSSEYVIIMSGKTYRYPRCRWNKIWRNLPNWNVKIFNKISRRPITDFGNYCLQKIILKRRLYYGFIVAKYA